MTVNMRRLVARPFKTGWCPGGTTSFQTSHCNPYSSRLRNFGSGGSGFGFSRGSFIAGTPGLGRDAYSSPKLSSVTVCFPKALPPNFVFSRCSHNWAHTTKAMTNLSNQGTNTNEKKQPAPLQDRERRQANAPHLQQAGLFIVVLALAGRLSL
jgi:hypothetical protein